MFAVVFHYFTDDILFPRCQGSLTREDFSEILDYLEEKYELLNADEFYSKALNGQGEENQVCLTFDDCLGSQWEVAVPVLEKRGLTGMFFCPSSQYSGTPSMLEIYHDFRFRCFQKIDEFYQSFFEVLYSSQFLTDEGRRKINSFSYDDYLKNSNWHSYKDKLFRYTRDCILSEEQYHRIMEQLMTQKRYEWKTIQKHLWISEDGLRSLRKNKHLIGLHSHTHPTTIESLSYERQLFEYQENKNCLERILGETISVAAYPCGKINEDTISIMKLLGVQLAFLATYSSESGILQFPRKNHNLILDEMRMN